MSRKLALLALSALWSVGATAQPPGRELLAREMYFEERAARRRSLWTADTLLAQFPEIVRRLRAEALPEVRLRADDCVETMPCYRELRHELSFAGTRLVTVFAEFSGYHGGAHGGTSASDWIWDRASRRRIRFVDIFVSWRVVRPLLRERVCTALREARPDGISECPDVDELAFGLRERSDVPLGGAATAIEVRTSDYQLGSYADGRETVWVDLDAPLLALVRPEYHPDLRLPD